MSDADEIQTLHALNDAQAAEIARLTAELEKCREDAERYRWLRTRITMSDLNGPLTTDPVPFLDRGSVPDDAYDADIDRAIDAARRSP